MERGAFPIKPPTWGFKHPAFSNYQASAPAAVIQFRIQRFTGISRRLIRIFTSIDLQCEPHLSEFTIS